VIDLWLSGEINSIQLNIELVITDIEKNSLLNLAFQCANAVKEELLSLSSVKVIFISFKTTEGLHACWIRGSKDSILSFISRNANLEEFEKVLFICYLGDVLFAAQKLDDLAKHSSFITKDFEIKEVLLEAAKHLEFLAKKAASDLDSLTDLTMKWSFQSSLLSCMLVVSRVISVTKDNDIAKQFIQFFGIFHSPNDVNVSQDYLNLFHNISIIIDMLKMRYIVIPNLRKISLGMEISQSPRIAIVQPKISINKDYKNFQLTKRWLNKTPKYL